MGIKQMIHKLHTKSAVRRWIVWLLCAVLIGGMISPALPVLAAGGGSAAETENKDLIAHYEFDKEDNRLIDSSGNNVEAVFYKVVGGLNDPDSRIESSEWSNYFDGTEEDGSKDALHLKGDEYLALPAGTLNGLTEMTVEMRIKLDDPQNPNNWLFYATSEEGELNGSRYVGMSINYANDTNTNSVIIPRYYGWQPYRNSITYDTDFDSRQWYTIRVVYKVSSMALYINGKRVKEVPVQFALSDCLGENNAIWIGHSGWNGNSNFRGYIDDIKIYNYAKVDDVDVGAINEKEYIIADAVDPEYTTVNMFDYWITNQKDADSFSSDRTAEWFMNSGINAGHLFLFAGSNGVPKLSESETVGDWNNYYGTGHKTYEPYAGIVKRVLKEGYPQLAIDELGAKGITIPSKLADRSDKQTESLDYLFDPNVDNPSRAVYSDVTGLFRLNEAGYHYFNSGNTYAELNRDQSTRPKTSKVGGNQITLYSKAWDNNFDPETQTTKEVLGQFFPFNDWSDLFYVGNDGELMQANDQGGQTTTDEPLNHYFGMTVETKFQQPESGLINDGSDPQHMEFYFSGDDDIWIFIDDVLVGDLGGLHMRVSLTIDFATGEIDYTGDLSGTTTEDGNPQPLEDFDTNLYEMFQAAGMEETVDWKEVDGNQLFADGSHHTLKFFYLERGNAASNCEISFNLQNADDDTPEQPPKDDDTPKQPPKGDEPGDDTTEQPPESDRPGDNTTEQPPGNDKPGDNTTEQPPADNSKTPQTYVVPDTGDNAMPELWFSLMAVGMAGIIGVTVVCYRRKSANKHP